MRVALVMPIATLHFGDGTPSSQVPLGYSFAYHVLGSSSLTARPSIPGVRWLAGDGRSSATTNTLTGVLTPEQRMTLDAKGATVVIDATVRVDTIEAGAPIRLGAGGAVRHEGRRLVIERWSHYGATPDIVLRTANLEDDPPYESGGGNEYALLNRRRGEALPLNRADLDQNLDGLVLPATTAWRTTARLSGVKRGPLDGELPGDEWYGDAQLLPIVSRTLGTYPVKFTLTIPPR